MIHPPSLLASSVRSVVEIITDVEFKPDIRSARVRVKAVFPRGGEARRLIAPFISFQGEDEATNAFGDLWRC
jgi:hypothetical protein